MRRAWSARQMEVAFGLGLLLPVALVLALAEAALRWRQAEHRAATVDWGALIEATATDVDGVARFQPNTAWGSVAFNERGLRGPTLPVPAPDRTVRLAVLGDSKMLSADLAQSEMLAQRLVERLSGRRPDCRIDAVTIAGPSYDMAVLARLWGEHAPDLDPDLAVVLAGSVVDLVQAHDAAAGPADRIAPPDRASHAGSWTNRSVLLATIRRHLAAVSPVRTQAQAGDLSPDRLAQAFDDMVAPLVEALSGTPIVALGYRSRSLTEGPAEARQEAVRNLRAELPGLSVAELTDLREMVVARMAAVAAGAGWTFVDPIAAFEGDVDLFADATHFSAAGIDRLAGDLVPIILGRLDAGCHVR